MMLSVVGHAACAAEIFGKVDAISGNADVVDQSGKSTVVSVGLNIYEGQTIASGSEGEVHIVTEDGGIIAVRPNTLFRVDAYKAEGNDNDKMFMSLLKGTIRSITGWVGKYNNAAYRITTPTATIGIRGTDHETTVIDSANGDAAGTYDNVNEGATVLKTPHGSADVVPGKFAFAAKDGAAAPAFLPQAPRFLALRRLRIEERIVQRKSVLKARLEQMREERMQRVRSIPGSHLKRVEGERSNAHEHEAAVRRQQLRQRRLERGRQQQIRHERLQKNDNSEEEKHRHFERKHNAVQKRD